MATVPPWPTSQAVNNTDSVPSVSTSDGTNDSEGAGEDDGSNDAEGVWSPDIEQSFQEALAIYPPCGRRKIILSDEGKMYGRNELIARYIKLRTGKTRTRKQVSSHIQVLARRKSKDIQTQLKNCPSVMAKEKALQSLSAMSSSQIVSVSAMRSGMPPANMSAVTSPPDSQEPLNFHNPATSQPVRWPPSAVQHSPMDLQTYYGSMLPMDVKPTLPIAGVTDGNRAPAWEGRSIAGPKLRMCEFTSFLTLHQNPPGSKNSLGSHEETHIFVDLGVPPTYADPQLEVVDIKQIYDKFPSSKGGLQDLFERGPNGAFFLVKFWADLSTSVAEDTPGTFYGVTSRYESREQMSISCSTKVCSFGKQVVEKVETEHAHYENGKYVYKFHRSPMCEYMITFIHKLKQLPEKYMMNSVLENFTILQVVQNRDTQETLLCIAFVFEISNADKGCQHSIYRLVRQ